MKVAVIIARGNSKRIKNKNIKIFYKRPIIEITFNKLKSFKIFDKIILSTDSEKIINKCSNIKFDLVIKRPKILGHDNVSTNEVMIHSADILKKTLNINFLCCVYPCALFLKKKEILNSIRLIKNSNDFIFPVLPYPEPIEQALDIDNDYNLTYVFPTNKKKNTKSFKKKYYDSGQFYLSTMSGWYSKYKNFKGIILPKYSAVDIDDIHDWNFAKYLYLKKNEKKN